MTPKERKRAQRERDKMTAEERLARLPSRGIVTDLYHNDDAAVERVMPQACIGEEQDPLSRLLRGADA